MVLTVLTLVMWKPEDKEYIPVFSDLFGNRLYQFGQNRPGLCDISDAFVNKDEMGGRLLYGTAVPLLLDIGHDKTENRGIVER